jgi:hemoglobin
VVDAFYERILADEELEIYFKDADMVKLQRGQYVFLKSVFTKIPDKFNASEYMYVKHERLFHMGLGGEEFDRVAEHLVATLQSLKVKQPLIDEVVYIVSPLRPYFVDGAERAAKEAKEAQQTREMKILFLAAGAVLAASYLVHKLYHFTKNDEES